MNLGKIVMKACCRKISTIRYYLNKTFLNKKAKQIYIYVYVYSYSQINVGKL